MIANLHPGAVFLRLIFACALVLAPATSAHAEPEPDTIGISLVVTGPHIGPCDALIVPPDILSIAIEIGALTNGFRDVGLTLHHLGTGDDGIQFLDVVAADGFTAQAKARSGHVEIEFAREESACGPIEGPTVLGYARFEAGLAWEFVDLGSREGERGGALMSTGCEGQKHRLDIGGCTALDLNDPHTATERTSFGAIKARMDR